MDQTAPRKQWWRIVLGVLLILSALCTVFLLPVTIVVAWQEHAQKGWPLATARVEQCDLQPTSGEEHRLYIRCSLSYAAGAGEYVASVSSRDVPSREVWQYPPNQMQPFVDWVNGHPPGTPILVRYNPGRHGKIVLVTDYPPGGGPQTPTNLKLLAVCAGSFVVLLAIAIIARQQSR